MARMRSEHGVQSAEVEQVQQLRLLQRASV
jgi:hypothetical protein